MPVAEAKRGDLPCSSDEEQPPSIEDGTRSDSNGSPDTDSQVRPAIRHVNSNDSQSSVEELIRLEESRRVDTNTTMMTRTTTNRSVDGQEVQSPVPSVTVSPRGNIDLEAQR